MIRKVIDRLRKGPRYRYRSAISGRIVPRWWAALHPRVSIRERVR